MVYNVKCYVTICQIRYIDDKLLYNVDEDEFFPLKERFLLEINQSFKYKFQLPLFT